MKTKRQDAASIVGDEFAEKLEEYERKLNRRKHKSEAAEDLILKAVHRNRVYSLVEKANQAYTLAEVYRAIQRTNQRTHDIAYSNLPWPRKVKRMQFIIQSFIDDLQEVGAWNDDVRRAVHRGVHRLKKAAEAAHVVTLVEQAETARREAEVIAADIRMRRVIGCRLW